MNPALDPARCEQGSVLLEALLAIVLFSIGMIGLLMLLTESIREDSASRYRGQAALLMDEAVAAMWSGNRDPAALAARFSVSGIDYEAWRARVQAQLPGAAAYPPRIAVASDGTVTIALQWRAATDPTGPHQLTSVTRIAP